MNVDTNWIVIGLALLGLVVLKELLRRPKGRGATTATAKTFPYGLRDAFLSPAEISFFHVLKGVLDSEHHLVAKVRLEDIFFVREPHRNLNARNLIAQKHVDFLICDRGSMQPLLGVELDDATHQQKRSKQRDAFVEKVFHAAELPLLRVKAARGYVPREIEEHINRLIGKEPAEPPPLPAATMGGPGR